MSDSNLILLKYKYILYFIKHYSDALVPILITCPFLTIKETAGYQLYYSQHTLITSPITLFFMRKSNPKYFQPIHIDSKSAYLKEKEIALLI